MKRTVLWVIAILLLFVFFTIRYRFVESYDISGPSELPKFIVELAATGFLAVIIGVLLALLTALIPFRKKNYGQKFTFILPILVSMTLTLLIVVFGYISYSYSSKGIDIHPNMSYDTIEIDSTLDCSGIKEGTFQIDNLLIKRHGNRQIQTYAGADTMEEYEITWLSNCEYSLVSTDGKNDFIKVKITSVSENGYECYVLSANGKYVAGYKIKRLKE